ncbi:hypothetical protein XELAEV_18044883mg [Xenopus laevis]|uniref:Uncharacterized protein n=1 Tax=Xenopus laevis TaxID=8355 RepID=A0A974BZX6_XENLA|nr:hypothetical protein XELAEV_18044883mg [Xenopus laevis]
MADSKVLGGTVLQGKNYCRGSPFSKNGGHLNICYVLISTIIKYVQVPFYMPQSWHLGHIKSLSQIGPP